jgi:hypothetical protein
MTNYLGSCKGCKGTVRVSPKVRVQRSSMGYGRTSYRVFVTLPGQTREIESGTTDYFFANCLCGKSVKFNRVRGVVTAHECNAKCLGSKGGVCECSCGGRNHGASYSGAA